MNNVSITSRLHNVFQNNFLHRISSYVNRSVNGFAIILVLSLSSVSLSYGEVLIQKAEGGDTCSGLCSQCLEYKPVPTFPYEVYDPKIINVRGDQCTVATYVWGCNKYNIYTDEWDDLGVYLPGGLCMKIVPNEFAHAGPLECPECIGNPISIGVNNKYQKEVDLIGSGVFSLNFERHYNSRLSLEVSSLGGKTATALGKKWRGTYDASIAGPYTNYATGYPIQKVAVIRPDGKAYFFQEEAGAWVPESAVDRKLEPINDGNGDITGWRYFTTNDHVETYDSIGKLTLITDVHGNTHSLHYDAATGELQRVESNQGEQLTFT